MSMDSNFDRGSASHVATRKPQPGVLYIYAARFTVYMHFEFHIRVLDLDAPGVFEYVPPGIIYLCASRSERSGITVF